VGGHTFVQPLSSVQVILPPCSEVSRYKVRPSPLTKTVPNPPTSVALRVMEASDWPGAVERGEDEDVLVFEELPHAAKTSADTVAIAATTSHLGVGPRRVSADALIARGSSGASHRSS
jgi:hypothetical protein